MDGEESSPCGILSGVLQRSVFGPVHFLVYINDRVTDVDSQKNLFVDEFALYREITSAEDANALKKDLERLYKWNCDWDMHFNVTKCYSMTFKLQRNVIATVYHISDVSVQNTSAKICKGKTWSIWLLGKRIDPSALYGETFLAAQTK